MLNPRTLRLVVCACLLLMSACAREATTTGDRLADSSRVVSVGGSVTETIYALGAERRLVGTDTSSIYPEAATKLPQVGYMRQLSSEGVLSLRPTLVIVAGDSGPPEAIEQIRSAGVPLIMLPADPTLDGSKRRIETIARALGVEERGREIVVRMERELDETRSQVARAETKPRVLVVIARGAGALSVSGTKTAANEMVELAGGTNAVTGCEGYRPLTPEAVVSAAPDVVLFPTRGLESIGGVEGALKLPGLLQTPAGKARRVVALDDLKLLGLTPRTGEAVRELVALLHPGLGQSGE